MLRLILLATFLAYCSGNTTNTTAKIPPWRAYLYPIVKERVPIDRAQTSIDQVPWVVAVHSNSLYQSNYMCEGAIIKPNSILTAAQCTMSPEPSSYLFRVGSSNRSSGGVIVPAKNVTRHESYTFPANDFDISIFILTKDLVLGPNVAIANLPTRNQTFEIGTMAVTAGWRPTVEDGLSVEVVNKMEIPIVHQGFCQTSYGGNVTSRMICGGITGKMLCSGEGAPLVVNGTLVGLGSWSTGCGRPGLPGVYTRVAYFIDWIEEHLP